MVLKSDEQTYSNLRSALEHIQQAQSDLARAKTVTIESDVRSFADDAIGALAMIRKLGNVELENLEKYV